MKKKIVIILIIIFLAGVGLGQNNLDNWLFNSDDSIIFLKVGQGDAILLQSEAGSRVLIDGGPDNAVVYRLGNYLPLFDMSLDGIFLTHPDLDHVLGVIEIMRRYDVKYLFITDFIAEKYLGRLAIEAAKKNNVKIVSIKTGDVINLSGINLTVLWPDGGIKIQDANNTSIILRVDFEYGSAILTGDASLEIEEILVTNFNTRPDLLDIDVFKAGHHGSRTATSPDFVEAITPQIGVVSAGEDNKFGHPHQEVLDILDKYDVKILDNIYHDLQINFTVEGLVVE